VNFRRLRTGLGLVAFFIVASAGAGVAQLGNNPNAPPPPPLPNVNRNATSQSTNGPVTPPPPTLAPDAVSSGIVPAGNAPTPTPNPNATLTPPPAAASAAPSAEASGAPKRGHKKAAATGTPAPEPTDSPVPPQFSTLDGIWEIELQPLGQRLANYQHFSLVQNGSTLSGYWEHKPGRTRTPVTGSFDGRLIQIQTNTGVTFSGYVEAFGDMVGMQHLSATDAGTAFTAQHRAKEKN
jgi:hypothetical protein